MAPTLASLLSHPLRLGELQVAGPITLAPLLGGSGARLTSLERALQGGAEARELPSPVVTEIIVRNPTAHALLLVDGEEIVGARQNRIVDGTCVVPAGAERVVSVCCVERERWDVARSAEAFMSSTQVMSPALRAVKSRTARETGRGDPRAVWAQVERTIAETSTSTVTRAVTDVFAKLGPRLDALVSDGRPWVRDLDMDLVRLREHHRVDALVGLLSDRELAALDLADYVARVTERGFALHRLAIRDGDVPSSMGVVRRLLAGVLPRVRRGERVVVHCRGGLGRAGTVAGCLLVELGLSSADALRALEARDPRRCPENAAQREFIRRYASSIRKTASA